MLHLFIAHFNEKVSMDKTLTKAYDPMLSLVQSKGEFLTKNINNIPSLDDFEYLSYDLSLARHIFDNLVAMMTPYHERFGTYSEFKAKL